MQFLPRAYPKQNGNTEYIWKLLDTVPDPEIPVISVVELGVVRDVKLSNNNYTIFITPTYSGCPAVKTFIDDIKICLKKMGSITLKSNLFIFLLGPQNG